jgi:acyl dehydratase
MTTVSVPSPVRVTTGELPALVGRVLGHSAWHTVTQADANTFGAATGDMQWIHTDPARAAHGPYGQTIAHGYLTLSLATALIAETLEVTDASMIVNYGTDRVRFPAPLPIGTQVRAQVTLARADAIDAGVQVRLHLEYDVYGTHKPCCVADVLLRYHTAARPDAAT